MPRRRRRVSVRGYGGGGSPSVSGYGGGGIATIGPIVKGASEGFVEGLKLRQEGNRLRQQAAQQDAVEARAIAAEKRAVETHTEGLTEKRLKTGREVITEAAKTEPILPTGVSREIVKGRLPTEILAESGLPPEVKAQMGQQVEQQFITRGVPKEVAPTLAKQYPYGVESIDWAKVREMRQKYGAEALSGIEKVGEEGYKSQQDIENALKLKGRLVGEGYEETPGDKRTKDMEAEIERERRLIEGNLKEKPGQTTDVTNRFLLNYYTDEKWKELAALNKKHFGSDWERQAGQTPETYLAEKYPNQPQKIVDYKSERKGIDNRFDPKIEYLRSQIEGARTTVPLEGAPKEPKQTVINRLIGVIREATLSPTEEDIRQKISTAPTVIKIMEDNGISIEELIKAIIPESSTQRPSSTPIKPFTPLGATPLPQKKSWQDYRTNPGR